MPTTEEDIHHLILIVKKDLEIKDKKRSLEALPERMKEIDREIKRMDDELSASTESIDKLEKEKRHIDTELKSQQAQVEEKKKKQRDVKTNAEYRAIMTEIEYITKLVDREEERILEILTETERKNKELAESRAQISTRRSALVAERNGLEAFLRESEDALKILEDEKIRILPHLSDGVRRLYQRILAVKGDSGVANLIGDICQGCYSRMPPQVAHEVRKNNQILTCEACGRILVHYLIQ